MRSGDFSWWVACVFPFPSLKHCNLAQQWFGIGNQGMYFTKGSEIILS
jgi:hypothetical protein